MRLTHVVDLDDLGDEFGHDRFIGDLEGVNELDSAVDVLNIFSFE